MIFRLFQCQRQLFRLFRSQPGEVYCDISTFPMSKDSNSARKVESPWQDSTVIFRLFLCQRELIPLEEWKARNFSTFPMPETTNSARKSGKPVTAALMVLVFRYCNISTFPFANG